jgi:hypothetical protein
MKTVIALITGGLALAGSAAVAAPRATTAATHRVCAAADLTARSVDTGGSGAGTIEFGIVFHNASRHTCVMGGFPGLGLLDSRERAMPGYAAFDHSRTPHTVTLAPGGRAEAIVRWSDVTSGGQTTCPKATFLLVTPPGRRVSLELRTSIAPCGGGRMLVAPVA